MNLLREVREREVGFFLRKHVGVLAKRQFGVAVPKLSGDPPPTDASPLSGVPVSSLLPVSDMGEGVYLAFAIPILSTTRKKSETDR